MPEWSLVLTVSMALLFGLAFFGVPIAFSLFASAFATIALFRGVDLAVAGIGPTLFGGTQSFSLLAVPLFILLAQLIIETGLSARTYAALARLFGAFRAGLLIANNLMLTFLGALLGSSAASITTAIAMSTPELQSRGYSNRTIAGLAAGAGSLAVVIPPSVLMVLYAFVMEQPVIPFFVAGIVPGLLISAAYCLWLLMSARRDDSAAVASTEPAPERAAADRSLAGALLDLAALGAVGAVMLLSMIMGYASVTEGAAIGVCGVIVVATLYRSLSMEALFRATWETVAAAGFIFFLMLGARYFGFLFTLTDVSERFAEWIVAMPLNGTLLLLAVMAAFILVGMVMEETTTMLVLVPIAASALIQHGFDPILLGILFILNLNLCMLMPPVGIYIFVTAGAGRKHGITFNDVVAGVIPYFLINIAVLALLVWQPAIVLWLPRALGY